MPLPLLSVFAVISIFALGVFALGYVADFGPAYLYNVVGGPKPHIFGVELRLQEGRIAVSWGTWDQAPVGFAPAGSHIYSRPVRFRLPDFRRSIWEYDAHPLVLASGAKVFLFAFPIWCAVIPCLIAPLLWLRKRRTPPPSAFPVMIPDSHAT